METNAIIAFVIDIINKILELLNIDYRVTVNEEEAAPEEIK